MTARKVAAGVGRYGFQLKCSITDCDDDEGVSFHVYTSNCKCEKFEKSITLALTLPKGADTSIIYSTFQGKLFALASVLARTGQKLYHAPVFSEEKTKVNER